MRMTPLIAALVGVALKTGYMAYHDHDLFFVVYLAYVNMSI